MLRHVRVPAGWVVRSSGSAAQLLLCLVRGHRWDPAPRAGVAMLRCVRCGMTAEPVSGL